jgi:hypothetical protein
MISQKKIPYSLITIFILLGACNQIQIGKPAIPPTYIEETYLDLTLGEIDSNILKDPGIPGCRLSDLPSFGWKEVDAGLVDIRTPEEYTRKTESLYQQGYLGYQQTREENPQTYQSIPEISYEQFLATCNVFPEIDFERYSVLGAQATGTGCNVTFEKQVYRDEGSQKIIYAVKVKEEGNCEKTSTNRNLILVPRIPPEYSVEFLIQATGND